MRHHAAWLWLGGTLGAFAAAFIGYAGALAAARTHFPIWTCGQMIAAYVLAAVSGICFIAAIRGFGFPFITVSASNSWDVETEAAGKRWGAQPLYRRGQLSLMLECYQRGARVTGLRCILHHPSGVTAIATNALAETFDRDHFNYVMWDYPGDFTRRGRGTLPEFAPGEYRIVWLAHVPGQVGAVQLCDVLWDVPAEGEPRMLRYGRDEQALEGGAA